MNTALFGPARYTGEFVTLHYQETRGWQVTLWSLGKAWRYTTHDSICAALKEILSAGAVAASDAMRAYFEQDVILAGEL